MNCKRRKPQLNQSLILTIEELKKVSGAGKKIEAQDIGICCNYDELCAITCAMYMHE